LGTMDIVNLIETNPITKFSGNYQSRLVGKLRESFTETQQQLFLANFYCYLNCSKTEFVVDLDDVWKWMGFNKKVNAKRCLENHFVAGKDYTVSLLHKEEQTIGRGGGNKQVFKLTVPAFKRFCLKAGTTKADEIHEYYIELEEVLQETICEESVELQKQLTVTHETEKCALRETTILSQFPNNTQCFYYGTIANVSGEGEPLVKFGMSNNLKSRRKDHRKTYDNFRLVNAFRVSNKTEMENAVKSDPEIAARIRTIMIKSHSLTELISMEGLSFDDLDKEIKRVMSEVEYNRENYTKLQATVKALRTQLAEANEANHGYQCDLAMAECKRLRVENRLITKRFNAISNRDNSFPRPLIAQPSQTISWPTAPPVGTPSPITNVCRDLKRVFHEDGSRTIDGIRYQKTMGTREEVFCGTAYYTSGRLHRNDLMRNHLGAIVSIRKSIHETKNDRFAKYGVNRGDSVPPNPPA